MFQKFIEIICLNGKHMDYFSVLKIVCEVLEFWFGYMQFNIKTSWKNVFSPLVVPYIKGKTGSEEIPWKWEHYDRITWRKKRPKNKLCGGWWGGKGNVYVIIVK